MLERMSVTLGLDRLCASEFASLRGKSIGLLCNQATIDSSRVHILDHFMRLHKEEFLNLHAVFGPQHGLFGQTQDNMIEWEAGGIDERTGLRIFSLYGEFRKPTPAMMQGIDQVVVDLPDIGSRYYTFAWTTALMVKACGRDGIPVLILDRPNPINGITTEGPMLDPEYLSFVGLLPVHSRHGKTLGELGRLAHTTFGSNCDLEVLETLNWDRSHYLEQTGAPWMLPSPNMPTVDTALVYPGACLIEGTNLSEGRGTGRPFEIVGAPFINSWKFADALNASGLPAVRFQPIEFMPTFNKYAGKLCEGVYFHVLDREAFRPWITYIALIQEAIRQTGLHSVSGQINETFVANSAETALPGFAWKMPPYEYEFEKMPIDILLGNGWLRPKIESLQPWTSIQEYCK